MTRQLVALVLIAAALVACAGAGETPRSSALADQERQLDEFARLRGDREKALAAMSIADLAAALQEDSAAGREPWNSLAVKEVQNRGGEVAPALAEFVRNPDRSSFLTLMAIRAVNKDIYGRISPDLRLAVLVDALAKAEYFNAFGLPHLFWEDPANAIIEEGPAAEKLLVPLLTDERPAPSWGEEQAQEAADYQYRVKDYALGLIRGIRGEDEPLPKDPAERDDLINQL